MTPSPLLSVIIANYNNGPFLEECLESVLSQSHKELEIVIVDDSSTDLSTEIIKQYETRYPRIVRGIYLSSNRGVAGARHEGIAAAKGEYITTLDSDDFYLDPGKLKAELGLVQEHKERSGQDVIAFSAVAFVDPESRVLPHRGRHIKIREGHIFNEIMGRSAMIPRDFVMARSLYREVGGYDTGLSTHEDWDLKIRLAHRYEFYYTGQKGTAYRQHDGGLSSISHQARSRNLWRVFYKNHSLVPPGQRTGIEKGFSEFMHRRDTIYAGRRFHRVLRCRLLEMKNRARLRLIKIQASQKE
jgi:glycosyltransferase involved in cell wall biosynthesis